MAKPVPCPVGVQVPCCDHTEVSPEGHLRKAPGTESARSSGSCADNGELNSWKGMQGRPRPPVLEHSAKVQRGPHTIGFLKGKSAVRIHRDLLQERRMSGLHFWSRGYCVSTVGLDEQRCGSISASRSS